MHLQAWHHPSIAHDALPDRELDEQWLLKTYGLAVHMRAHTSSMRKAIDGTGCRCALAPHPRLSHKRVPMDQTFSWKLAHHVKLLGKETWSTRVEHLEALLFEQRRNKRHFGDSMQWSRFVDTDGAAMTFRCRRRWTTEAALLVIQRKRLEAAR